MSKTLFLFIDESGHHGLKKIQQEFPIFLLCGCIFDKSYYQTEFTRLIEEIKVKYFSDKNIIFHSRDIRKWQKDFKCLGDINKRKLFYEDLEAVFKKSDFKIISSAIKKNELIRHYGPNADNPYSISLAFILERAIFLSDNLGYDSINIFVESRGKKEDERLFSQFQMIVSNGTFYVKPDKLKKKIKDFLFSKKKENNVGIQIADLMAYPIATKILFPERINLAFDVIEPKIYRQFLGGDYLGYGLKIFP